MPLRVAIVDDEPLVRRGIRSLLTADPTVTIVGEARDGEEAVNLIRAERPGLVFLDVRMPGLDGFDVLTALSSAPLPAVIFVTAHADHAIRAFDHHAVDYLLKPFDAERFHVALARAQSRLAEPGGGNASAGIGRALDEIRRAPGYIDRILVRHAGRATVVPVTEIVWLQAADNHVRIHATKGSHLVRMPLQLFERQLDPERFARIHRSAIVRIDQIRDMRTLFGGANEIRLQNGTRLPLSRGHRDRIRVLLGAGERARA